MNIRDWVRTCGRAAALGFIALLANAGTVLADTITLTPLEAVYARDGGLNFDPVVDGQFDAVYTGSTIYVWRTVQDSVQREYRAGFAFQLPPEVIKPGVTIASATLHVEASTETVAIADVVTVHGVPNAIPTFIMDDFEVVNPIAHATLTPGTSWSPTHDFNVTSHLQSLVGNGNNRTEITFAAGQWGTQLNWNNNATLKIVYSTTNGNPPALSILAPANGSTVLQGDQTTFEATASDVEDGNLAATVQWSSSKNGPIGSGGSFSTNTLSAGSHVITATVVDADGNTAAKTISLQVQPSGSTPPTITLLAPTEGSTFTQGSPINFQAIASDAQDGDRTAYIQWYSNINGSIGTGGSFTKSNLSPGTHQIQATVYDTTGGSAAWLVNIAVQAPVNTAPTVNVTAPTNGAALTAGVSFNLAGTANDAQQGSMGSSIQWILDGVTTIATGANATAVISTPGPHTITARVTDSGGLTGEQIVNVSVSSGGPASYCSLRGETSTYEWIQAVKSGATNNVSNNNGGYGDYTSVTFNMVSAPGNSIVITPGFSSGTYTERLYVWIDLNRDKTFSANELLVSTMISSTYTANFAIPAGTAAGPTRMRIALSYGTTPPDCGTFRYGEVEDYTVNIQSPGTLPTGPTYCSSRGTSTYEFIQQVAVNGQTRPTGNNAGYRDLTSSPTIPLARGANPLALTPGFTSGNYPEQWMVWIDFNKDGVFGNEDWVFGGGGSSTVNGSANVPTSAASGVTRMRIQMKYGSAATPCETFSYGEVEDYAVMIP